MAKKFEELKAKMSPESRKKSRAMAEEMLIEMEKPLTINNLRRQVELMGGKLEIAARWPDGSCDYWEE